MRKFSLKFSCLILTVFLSQNFSYAGGGLTGEDGGHGVLCHEDGSIDRFILELLDRYEYRRLNHIPLKGYYSQIYGDDGWKIPSQTRDILFARKSAYLAAGYRDQITLAALDHAVALVDSVKLSFLVDDTKDYQQTLVNLPDNCQIIQLATYSKSEKGEQILVDREAAEFMRTEDLAALLLHEAFHAYIHDENTISIRQRVGKIFSL